MTSDYWWAALAQLNKGDRRLICKYQYTYTYLHNKYIFLHIIHIDPDNGNNKDVQNVGSRWMRKRNTAYY